MILNLIGQTLDGKYAIERELGRGGMGTVYFANHIGTERPVAVKVISPQYMAKTEHIERFRREARAAGRLRHPNVVDVTDFGIAETSSGKIAYLVMEYLDGCTLGEILEEEKQIPLSWSLDILEQVCSAVHEAHEQGIIHRDLKPDNIWLEPNQRGGYTVKVLDFGIAKLEEHIVGENAGHFLPGAATETGAFRQQATIADQEQSGTVLMPPNSTMASDSATMSFPNEAGTLISEAGTLIKPAGPDLEAGTAIMPKQTDTDWSPDDGTRFMSEASDRSQERTMPDSKTHSSVDLTRIGAVLGTPLYMSPEQCRGEKLDPRSDIYSLGIISYQMLGGATPFSGDYSEVMKAHKEMPPPPLKAKRVPRRVKKVVMSALSKDPEGRPQTAEGLASTLRAHSEGMSFLFRKSLAIYAEHLPQFLLLAFVAGIPVLVLTVIKVIVHFLGLSEVVSPLTAQISEAAIAFVSFFVQILYVVTLVGTTTWMVAQILAAPLRPLSLRAAFIQVKKRIKPLFWALFVNTILTFIGFFLLVIPGVWVTIRNMLVAPVVMMEGLSGRKAFRRSKELVMRSFPTAIGTVFVMFIMPIVLAGFIGLSIKGVSRTISDIRQEIQRKQAVAAAQAQAQGGDDEGDNKKMMQKAASAVNAGIFELVWAPVFILMTSFTSIITALIYFKTRQAGGESMQDLLVQFEEADRPQTRWQERVRQRLMQSGRSSGSRSSGGRPASKP